MGGGGKAWSACPPPSRHDPLAPGRPEARTRSPRPLSRGQGFSLFLQYRGLSPGFSGVEEVFNNKVPNPSFPLFMIHLGTQCSPPPLQFVGCGVARFFLLHILKRNWRDGCRTRLRGDRTNRQSHRLSLPSAPRGEAGLAPPLAPRFLPSSARRRLPETGTARRARAGAGTENWAGAGGNQSH